MWQAVRARRIRITRAQVLRKYPAIGIYKPLDQSDIIRWDSSRGLVAQSVDLDSRIDLADERVSSVESNCAGQQPECEDHQRGVAEVQQCRNELRNLQL